MIIVCQIDGINWSGFLTLCYNIHNTFQKGKPQIVLQISTLRPRPQLFFDFDAAEDVALTQLLKEEGVADIQAYKDYYVPMNKALWKDLEQKKISKQELVNTRFSRLFAHFGQEKTVVF